MRILNAVGFYVPVHHGIDGESGHRLDAEFLRDVLAVGDDGGEADIQFLGYFFVDESFGYEHQHFDFAGGKVVLHRLRMFASVVSVSPFVHPENGLDQCFLILMDVEGGDSR